MREKFSYEFLSLVRGLTLDPSKIQSPSELSLLATSCPMIHLFLVQSGNAKQKKTTARRGISQDNNGTMGNENMRGAGFEPTNSFENRS